MHIIHISLKNDFLQLFFKLKVDYKIIKKIKLKFLRISFSSKDPLMRMQFSYPTRAHTCIIKSSHKTTSYFTNVHRINEKLMSTLIGYARVSTKEQDLQLQLTALEKAGCTKNRIFVDKISGSKTQRPGLDACLDELKEGNTLIVWRLDRLGRSMHHLILLIEDLRQKGISFKSICDGSIDTTTASGELVFNIFSSLAQFERRLIQERTKAGLDAARSRGKRGGRKKIEPTNPKVLMAKKMQKHHEMSITDICKTLKISRASFYRYLSL
jgi:DNA invertase Pin-like site-specific DNA recombinase